MQGTAVIQLHDLINQGFFNLRGIHFIKFKWIRFLLYGDEDHN
jgi:hypothetical protein